MDQRIRLRQLEYFTEAVRSGSIFKAAERLNVSQPAVTKSLRELEAGLGVRLMDRGRKGVELTPYGTALLPYAEDAISAVNAGLARIEEVQKAEQGHVTIGTSPIGMSRMVPMAISRLKETNPLVVVTIIPGDGDIILPALKLGEVDIVVGRAGTPTRMTGLTHEVLLEDRLAFVARPQHPLAGSAGVSLSQLVQFPWFVPQRNTVVREYIERLLRDHGEPFPSNYVEGMINSASGYVIRSDAIAAIPHEFAADNIEFGKVIELNVDFEAMLDPIGITRRENTELAQPAQLLIQELRRAAARLRQTNQQAAE